MEEIWKDIPDYEGIYQASNLGQIRTCEGKTTYSKRHGIRHWKQRVLKLKWSKCAKNQRRFDARVELWKNGKHKTYLVARLVASAFLGKSDLTVNHIDGNTLNNCIENLEYVSLADNIKKGFETNLYPQKPILIFDKENGYVVFCRSFARGSLFINEDTGYISGRIKKGIHENSRYGWFVL